jgi:hypothetical protein
MSFRLHFSVSVPVATCSAKFVQSLDLWRRVRFEVFMCDDYAECFLLGYESPVRTSQETHYPSVTESSRLMLCKISGFHFNGYEECRLLGYKNPVHTSQKTYYVSATEPSQLMLCKILCFHGDEYKECRLLGCNAVWLL